MPEALDRCQACRARLGEDPVCPRCGCDFALVRRAMGQAEYLLEQSVRALTRGDWAAAASQIDASLASNRQRLAEAIKAFIREKVSGQQGEPGGWSSEPRHGEAEAEEGLRQGEAEWWRLDAAEAQG